MRFKFLIESRLLLRTNHGAGQKLKYSGEKREREREKGAIAFGLFDLEECLAGGMLLLITRTSVAKFD